MTVINAIKELIEGAFVGQAIIATMVVATSCYMVVKGVGIPEWFVGLTTLVVYHYFREQTQTRVYRQELKRAKEMIAKP